MLGRFLSADPFIPDISNLQALNRYSYVTNNPLSFVDPNGYWPGFVDDAVNWVGNAIGDAVGAVGSAIGAFANAYGSIISASANWVKENWKTLAVVAVAVVVSAVTMGAAAPLMGSFAAAVLSGAAAGFASTFVAGTLNGQSIGDALKSSFKGAAIGALSAGLTYGVGSAAGAVAGQSANSGFSVAEYGIKVAGHGIVQGGITELNGGKFAHGFYSGAISGGTEGVVAGIDNEALQYASASAIGGTTSAVSGGSFVNGAVTGAYVMMFNHAIHSTPSKDENDRVPASTPNECNSWVDQQMEKSYKFQQEVNNAMTPEDKRITVWEDRADGAGGHIYNAIPGLYNITRVLRGCETIWPTSSPSPSPSPSSNPSQLQSQPIILY